MATGFFGGMLGKAEGELKSRKSKIDAAEEQATSNASSGASDMKVTPDTTQKDEKPVSRPQQSKKWFE